MITPGLRFLFFFVCGLMKNLKHKMLWKVAPIIAKNLKPSLNNFIPDQFLSADDIMHYTYEEQ